MPPGATTPKGFCLPCTPNFQWRSTRRAFYAGGDALLTGIFTMLDTGAAATGEDVANMNALRAELDQFANDVRDGLA